MAMAEAATDMGFVLPEETNYHGIGLNMMERWACQTDLDPWSVHRVSRNGLESFQMMRNETQVSSSK
jgi:hypothetical protein